MVVHSQLGRGIGVCVYLRWSRAVVKHRGRTSLHAIGVTVILWIVVIAIYRRLESPASTLHFRS